MLLQLPKHNESTKKKRETYAFESLIICTLSSQLTIEDEIKTNN